MPMQLLITLLSNFKMPTKYNPFTRNFDIVSPSTPPFPFEYRAVGGELTIQDNSLIGGSLERVTKNSATLSIISEEVSLNSVTGTMTFHLALATNDFIYADVKKQIIF